MQIKINYLQESICKIHLFFIAITFSGTDFGEILLLSK